MVDDQATAYTKSHASVTQGGSPLKRYQKVIIGRTTWRSFLYYEFCIWLANIPGVLGLFLRKKFWPGLFGSCGKGVLFSSHVTLRHPHRIHLGDNVIISERCLLDARTETEERVISLGDNVILSNDVALSCKGGTITIGDNVGIGTQTVFQSTTDCSVRIGEDSMLGPRCFIIAGGNYHTERTDIPMRKQGNKPDTGVDIANDVWLGANVSVLGGSKIGTGSIIGASSLVTRDIPAWSVAFGIPAAVVKSRKNK